MRIVNGNLHEEYRLPNKITCPTCGSMQSGAVGYSENDNRAPEPGDFGICAACGDILRYSTDEIGRLLLLEMTPADYMEAILSGCILELIKGQEYIRTTNHGLPISK